MPIINWYKIYSVNNELIDSQHKKLFDIFNRLYDNCLNKEDVYCNSIIDELISYSACHFAEEERFMKERNHRDIDDHIKDHQYFSGKVMELKQADIINRNETSKELIAFLANWLLNHEIEKDKKFVTAL